MINREDPGNDFGISPAAWNFMVFLVNLMLFPRNQGKNLWSHLLFKFSTFAAGFPIPTFPIELKCNNTTQRGRGSSFSFFFSLFLFLSRLFWRLNNHPTNFVTTKWSPCFSLALTRTATSWLLIVSR